MAQWAKRDQKYNLNNYDNYEVVLLSDEYGGLYTNRYSRDAWGRPKTILDYSLFSATWTFDVPARVWEEIDYDITTFVDIPKPTFENSTSKQGMLSVVSGTTVNKASVCRTKRHFRYEPNRGQLFSTSGIFPNPTTKGDRRISMLTPINGVMFQLVGDGDNWDMFVVRRNNGNNELVKSIKKFLPEDFDPGKHHLYDIQYDSDISFFVDLKLVYVDSTNNTSDSLIFQDQALPVAYTAICLEEGTEVELLIGSVDITSEGGMEPRKLFGSVNTGASLLTCAAAGTDTAILAMKVPRNITYDSSTIYYSRGCEMDQLVTWTRDESRTSVYLFRDINASNLNNLTWDSTPDSNLLYLRGGNTSALHTAFGLDKNYGMKVLSEWVEQDFKNVIENPGKNSDFVLSPGDILVITVSPITTNVKSSATLYYSEEI